MEPIAVRYATLDDAAVICTIYNQGIADRVATLETEFRDMDERRRWLSARGTRYPVVVGETAGGGGAGGGPHFFNPRRGCDNVAGHFASLGGGRRGGGGGRGASDAGSAHRPRPAAGLPQARPRVFSQQQGGRGPL